jgi:small subunit ribosomal protein S9
MADDLALENGDEGLTLPDATDVTADLEIGSQAGETTAVAERPAPTIRGKLDRFGTAMGTGRRKTAVARVRIKDGSGKILINERDVKEYFPLERDQRMILAPLSATETVGSVDVWVRVDGGGPTGQTGAVVLGIARALQAKNPNLHPKLSEGGFLTRDSRMVERKKYGHKKARRSFQFSKR